MMKRKVYVMRTLIVLLSVSVVFVTGMAGAALDSDKEFYVIVNVDNSIDSISANQLSRIFNKKVKKFENDMASLPIAQKSSRSVTKIFNKTILKKNAKQLKYYWARKMFSGSSKPPKSLASDTEVIKFVASLKNAVGYVSEMPTNKKVKVILIDP